MTEGPDAARGQQDRRLFVAVAGNIGAGKSSFISLLERRYRFSALYEPNEDNPFLEDFYAEMKRWAFHSQVFFLTKKFRFQKQLADYDGRIAVDRTVWEDVRVFAGHLAASGALNAHEWATLEELFTAVEPFLRRPDLLIYLKCPTRTLLRRIAGRGRAMEAGIDSGYLGALNRRYDRWYESWDYGDKLTLDTHRFDPETNLVDLHAMDECLRPWLEPDE